MLKDVAPKVRIKLDVSLYPKDIYLITSARIEAAKKIGFVDRYPKYPNNASPATLSGYFSRVHNWTRKFEHALREYNQAQSKNNPSVVPIEVVVKSRRFNPENIFA